MSKALKWALVISVCAVFGMMSLVGMYLIYHSLIAASVSFGLAVLIEGEVFKQNIDSFIKKFKYGLEKTVLLGVLLKYLIKLDKQNKDNGLLQDLIKICNNLHRLRHKKQTDAIKQQIKCWEQRQATLLDLLYERVIVNPQTDIKDAFSKDIKNLKELLDAEGFKAKIKLTKYLLIFSKTFITFVMLSATFTSFYMLHAGMALLYTGGITLFAIAPFAVIAGVAYSIVLYNSVINMLRDDLYRSFWKKAVDKCKQRPWLWLAIGLVILLGIVATIATAGTWWYAVKASATLLPKAYSLAVNVLNYFTIGFTFLYSMIFNFSNTCESIAVLWNAHIKATIKKWLGDTWAGICRAWQNENPCQFFNPVRICSKIISGVFRTLVFIGHIVSAAVTADGLRGLSPLITASAAGVNEAAVEGHVVFEHDCGGHGHPLDNEHEHHHSDLAGKFLFIPVLIFDLASTIWDGFWYALGYGVNKITSLFCTAEPSAKGNEYEYIWVKNIKRLKGIFNSHHSHHSHSHTTHCGGTHVHDEGCKEHKQAHAGHKAEKKAHTHSHTTHCGGTHVHDEDCKEHKQGHAGHKGEKKAHTHSHTTHCGGTHVHDEGCKEHKQTHAGHKAEKKEDKKEHHHAHHKGCHAHHHDSEPLHYQNSIDTKTMITMLDRRESELRDARVRKNIAKQKITKLKLIKNGLTGSNHADDKEQKRDKKQFDFDRVISQNQRIFSSHRGCKLTKQTKTQECINDLTAFYHFSTASAC